MPDVVTVITLGVLCLAFGVAVLIAHALSRPVTGRHTQRSGSADPAAGDGPDGSGWLARIRPAHLPRAGCLVTSDLLEDPWDLARQVRPAGPRPLRQPAADTGEMLAFGHITPAEQAARNARKFYPPEVTR